MATTIIYVYDLETMAPIDGATVTCTLQTPRLTNSEGFAAFELVTGYPYALRADAEGYVISKQKRLLGGFPALEFGLEKEEQIQITIKRPTWVSMLLWPEQAEYPTGEELQVRGYLRYEAEPYTEGEVWLIDTDTGEVISDRYPLDVGGSYTLKWTPLAYRPEGYNVTVGCDAFVSGSNPLGAWSEMPNGSTLHISVVGGEEANMRIITFGPHGELLSNPTITACDDYERACTKLKFQIWNESVITASAWYKVSIVGGATLYEGTTSVLGRGIGEFSEEITKYVCALPSGLPVGTHTVKVETGPVGQGPTHTKTEDINVVSATTLSVTTYDAVSTSESGARLKGSVVNTNDQETDIGFEYGETTSYGSTVWADITTTPCDFYKDITGLDSHTLYHFRAIAENAVKSANGEDMTFWTREELGGLYFNILLPNDTLLESGEVFACDNHTLACTHFNFQIKNGKGSEATAWYTVSVVGGATLYDDTVTIRAYSTSPTISDTICALPGGLPIGEHEILVEVGLVGHGPDASESRWLTVLEYGTPTVETKGVENPTLNSATLVGELKDVGIEARVGFAYGLLHGSINTVWREGYIRGGEFKVAARDLEGNELYRYRAVAKMGDNLGYGEEKTFKTVPAVINAISLGWNLEDAKMREYNAHFNVSNLSEAKRYRITLYGDKGYEYTRIDPVTNTTSIEIKKNIPLEIFEEHGYALSCGVYDLDIREYLITKSYIVPPFDLKLFTNIGGPKTSIPTTIRTETDYRFKIQIDNEGDKDREAAILFFFKGIDLGPGFVFAYPHDEPCLEEESIPIPIGQSVSYEIIVNIPNEAIPTGATSASYDLEIMLAAFEHE